MDKWWTLLIGGWMVDGRWWWWGKSGSALASRKWENFRHSGKGRARGREWVLCFGGCVFRGTLRERERLSESERQCERQWKRESGWNWGRQERSRAFPLYDLLTLENVFYCKCCSATNAHYSSGENILYVGNVNGYSSAVPIPFPPGGVGDPSANCCTPLYIHTYIHVTVGRVKATQHKRHTIKHTWSVQMAGVHLISAPCANTGRCDGRGYVIFQQKIPGNNFTTRVQRLYDEG